MKLEMRCRRVELTDELRDFLKERLRASLGRFARRISRVRVYLRDVNGPRGGLGDVCRIVVEVPPRGRVVVTGADTDIRAAIFDAANRAGYAVRRHLKRRRARRRLARHPVLT